MWELDSFFERFYKKNLLFHYVNHESFSDFRNHKFSLAMKTAQGVLRVPLPNVDQNDNLFLCLKNAVTSGANQQWLVTLPRF